MTIALAAMARHPYCSPVKTRLGPRLEPAARAVLYVAFLADKLRQLRSVRAATPMLCFTPSEQEAWFREFAGPGIGLLPQREGALGVRLCAAFDDLFARHAGVILLDTDTPNLPETYLESAVRALERGEPLVIGPAEDGGYYLIGLARPLPQLFDAVEWSTARTREQTLAAAERLGLAALLLPAWYDVDRPQDLDRLERELAAHGGAAAPHTWNALQRLRGQADL